MAGQVPAEALVPLLVQGFVPALIVQRERDDEMVRFAVREGEDVAFHVRFIQTDVVRELIFEPSDKDDIAQPLTIDLVAMDTADWSAVYARSVMQWMSLVVTFRVNELLCLLVADQFRRATWLSRFHR